jgi:transcription initiation factor TFIIB
MTTLTAIAEKCRVRSCPECKGTRLVEHQEEDCSVCLDCGFVISSKTINRTSRKKANIDSCKHIHLGSESVQRDLCIENKEANQEELARVSEQWRHVRIGDSTEKNLALALQHITKIAVDLSLPKIVLEKACLTYERIAEKRLIKGRSMKVVCATAVCIGCKQCRTAVTTKDIAHASGVSPHKIGHSYRAIMKQLNFSIQPRVLSDHAKELSARLHVSQRTMDVTAKIMRALDCSNRFTGKDPAGIASAAIYISSLLTGERRTQREIAEAVRLTEATIRTRCREVERSLIFSFHL